MSEAGFRNSGAGAGVPSSVSLTALVNTSTSHASQSNLNPEADSFAYMETLLESLAVLSKLGAALDNVAQRISGEVYTLVETTVDEVEERAEYGRRGSLFALNGSLRRSDAVYVFATGDAIAGVGPQPMAQGGLYPASCLRLPALESSIKQIDHEILKDLYWTLYSKLDAVAQGLRVVYEVANRIGSVSVIYFADMAAGN